MAFDKYLDQYAEPEARVAIPGTDVFSHVVAVPARSEDPAFVEGLQPALAAGAGPSLVIVVVNGRNGDRSTVQARNRDLLKALRERTLNNATLLVVDRCSPQKRFGPEDGVGLARKIAGDIALAAIAKKRVKAHWIFMTDADVKLPEDYLRDPNAHGIARNAAAITFPFAHEDPGPAIALYEMSLRYYVLGLSWAGSPYAFHSVGSTMAVRADAYAAVRGVPPRQAGEDFYLLNKLAKVGPIWQPAGSRISIQDRESDRVPFGTGAARARIEPQLASGEPFCVYHPSSFVALRTLLRAMATFAETGKLALGDARLQAAVDKLGLPVAFDRAREKTASPGQLYRRIHEWFDGFRTMRLMHELRDAGLADLPWREAYERAPFLAVPTGAIKSPHIPSWQREMLYLENGHLPRLSGVRTAVLQGQGTPASAATRPSTALSAS